jgi:hypothetical protein
MTPDTALKTLGLGVPVTRTELKAAFRTIAKQSHPDMTQRKDSTRFRTAKDAYDTLLPLVPLAAGEVEDVDEDVEVDVEDEADSYRYTPPPEPATPPRPRHYTCGRCGKSMRTETEPEGRRMHWAERRDYPGCPPTTRARNAQCQADALPNGFR